MTAPRQAAGISEKHQASRQSSACQRDHEGTRREEGCGREPQAVTKVPDDRQKGVLWRTARTLCCALNPPLSSAPGPHPRMNLPVLVLVEDKG